MIIEQELTKYYLSIDNFEGEIQDVVNGLLKLEKAAKSEGYHDIRIGIDYGDYEANVSLALYGKREETAKEIEKRVKAEEKAKNAAAAKVKKEIEELTKMAEKHGFKVVKC